MKIGLDVDGVLTNQEDFQLKYGMKYFKKATNIDENGYDIEDIFHCTHKEREKFWFKYIWKYCLKEPIRKDVVNAINRLKAAGNEIHVITGRAHTTEQNITGKLFRKMLIYRLKKAGLQYDSITYCSEKESAQDKVDACEKLGIDVMIEDKKENIIALKDICRGIVCIDTKNNQGIYGENIFHITDDFSKISDFVQEIAKKSENNDSFVILDRDEVEKLSSIEKIDYYKNLKQFYLNLPYDLKKHKREEKLYSISSKVGSPIFRKIFKPIYFNRELIPTKENVIFVSNHLNYYDQFQIISALQNIPIHFLTSTKMLALKRGVFYRATGAIPVDREDTNDRRDAKEEVIKVLLNGGNVFIFPEGKTNREGKFIQAFKPGAVSIARTTGKRIVPIAINDNYKKDDGELCVRFGTPLTIKPTDNVIEKTEELKSIICGLMWDNMEYVQKAEKIKNNQQQKVKKLK